VHLNLGVVWYTTHFGIVVEILSKLQSSLKVLILQINFTLGLDEREIPSLHACLEEIMVRMEIQVSICIEQDLAMFIAFTYYLECLSYGREWKESDWHCFRLDHDGRKYQNLRIVESCITKTYVIYSPKKPGKQDAAVTKIPLYIGPTHDPDNRLLEVTLGEYG